MKIYTTKRPRSGQAIAGFSLVEALVGITVGLLLLTGVLKIFQGSQQAQRLQSALEEIQETSRFVLDFMSYDLRMAGYPRNNPAIFPPITGTDNTGINGSDTITIQYESPNNCGGEATGSAITQNQYLLETNASAAVELRCISSTATGTKRYSIATGVENLQILYGQDTDFNSDGIVNVYRTAANVTYWSRVLSLRLALLLATSNFVNASQTKTLQLLNEPPLGAFTDGHLRRIYSTTIVLRNQRK